MPKLNYEVLQSASATKVETTPILNLDGLKLDGDLFILFSCQYLAFLTARYNMLSSLKGVEHCICLWILDLQQNPVFL